MASDGNTTVCYLYTMVLKFMYFSIYKELHGLS